MAAKSELLGSFGSLLDTLRTRFDPFQPDDINSRWLGLTGRAAAIARDNGRWMALAEESQSYDQVIRRLDAATRSLVTADYTTPASVHAALDAVETALDALAGLVG